MTIDVFRDSQNVILPQNSLHPN